MKLKSLFFLCIMLVIFGMAGCSGGDVESDEDTSVGNTPDATETEEAPSENSLPEFLSLETDWGTFKETECGGAFSMCVNPAQPLKLGECVNITINASDPEGDDLNYKFELMNVDLETRIGISLPGSYALFDKISGGSNTVKICAYPESEVPPPRVIDLWVQVSDNENLFPYNQGLVSFYIDEDSTECSITNNCSYKQCYNGDVWCYDNCGDRNYIDEACSDGCNGGSCNIEGVDITNVSYIDDDTSTGDKLYYVDTSLGNTRVQFALAVPVYDESLPDAFDLGVNLPSSGDYPTSAASADMSDLRETPGALFEFTSSSSPPFEHGRYYILVEKRSSGGPFRIRAWLRSF